MVRGGRSHIFLSRGLRRNNPMPHQEFGPCCHVLSTSVGQTVSFMGVVLRVQKSGVDGMKRHILKHGSLDCGQHQGRVASGLRVSQPRLLRGH